MNALINVSATSADPDESDYVINISRDPNPLTANIIDGILLSIIALGIVGNYFMFRVSKYMVQVEKRAG